MVKHILFILFVCTIIACSNSKEAEKIIVDVQPLENISEEKINLATDIIRRAYGFQVQALENKTIPETFITRKKGLRYRADKIIKWLNENTQQKTDYTIGITYVEICTDKKNKFGMQKKPESKYRDWAVFGLGYINRSGCVVSTKRLGSGALGNTRFQKVVLHELGHNLGLPHCPNNCVMADAAETIKTVDKVPMALCEGCKAKIN